MNWVCANSSVQFTRFVSTKPIVCTPLRLQFFLARLITQDMTVQLFYLRSANVYLLSGNESTGHRYFKIQEHPWLNLHKGINGAEQVSLSRIRMGNVPCRKYLHRLGLEKDLQNLLNGGRDHRLQCSALGSVRSFSKAKLPTILQDANGNWLIIIKVIKELELRSHSMELYPHSIPCPLNVSDLTLSNEKIKINFYGHSVALHPIKIRSLTAYCH